MSTQTVTVDFRIYRTQPPPEHADYSPCLCNTCWDSYLDWCDREAGSAP
jgi:hypothetical protein